MRSKSIAMNMTPRKSSILKPLFFLTKNSVIGAGVSYALTIYLANTLGPGLFGVYSTALIYASFLSIIMAFGVDQTAPVQFTLSGRKDELLTLVLSVRVITVGICIVFVIGYSFFDFIVAVYILCLLLAGLNLAFYYEANQSNERYSYIFLGQRLIYAVAVFAAFKFNGPNLHFVFVLFLLSQIIGLSLQYRDFRHDIHKTSIAVRKEVWKYLSKNIPIVIIAFSAFSYGGFGRIILELRMGKEALGIYSAGWQFIVIGTIFQAQVTRVWRLRISQAIANRELLELGELTRSYFYFATLPISVVACALAASSSLLASALFLDAYSQIADLLPIFAIYLVVINIAGFAEILWIAVHRSTSYMTVSLSFGLLLLLILGLVPAGTSPVFFAAATVLLHFISSVFLLLFWAVTTKFLWDKSASSSI